MKTTQENVRGHPSPTLDVNCSWRSGEDLTSNNLNDSEELVTILKLSVRFLELGFLSTTVSKELWCIVWIRTLVYTLIVIVW